MAEEIGFQGEALRKNIHETQPIKQGGGAESNGGTTISFPGDCSVRAPSTTGVMDPSTSANGPTNSQQYNVQKASAVLSNKDSSQKDRLPYKDREERVRQMRERQQLERQQKLEELKEQAAAAQRFREQQEAVRRQRLEEMRSKDCERRTQVEERKRLIQQAEQERREAVLRKSAEREQRLDLKRRQERSNAVFAFGSSTPRMLDPKEASPSHFGGRRATSTTNVNLSDSSSAIRPSESQEPTDLSRKRATSAHSLIRKPEDLRMSTSMYEVFNWDDGVGPAATSVQPPSTQGTRLTKSRDSSIERRPRVPLVPGPPRSFTPDSPIPRTTSLPHSSSSSNSSEKTLVPSQDSSRFSVWEFGDNFTALGPTVPPTHGLKTFAGFAPLSFTSPTTPNPTQHFATAPTTPTSSRRTASVLTGSGCAYGGDDTSIRPFAAPPPTAARRRTDLLPTFPSLRDTNSSSRGSPRHRSPGRAHSLGRLDQLSRPRPQRPPSLAPLHESSSSKVKSMKPARTMSKSMSHLGPQRARPPIGPATDGAGVPVAEGSLDRRSSRSSLALSHPRMTRAEKLRLSKLRGGSIDAAGIRSGAATPGSPSRPTSSLSQSSGGNSQVMVRSRASPKKPRPLSIAGSTLSSADNPRESASAVAPPSAAPASPNRESRSIERKSSTGSITSKPARAKSVGSDRSTPSTPAKAPRVTTQKRTPAQVKADSAAKKAFERSNGAKPRSTPKTTPLQSPSVESKAALGAEKSVNKSKPSKVTNEKEIESEKNKPLKDIVKTQEPSTVLVDSGAIVKVEGELVTEDVKLDQKPEEIKNEQTKEEKEIVAPLESATTITDKPEEASHSTSGKSENVTEATPMVPVEAGHATPSVLLEADQTKPSVSVDADQATPNTPVDANQATPSMPVDADQATPSMPVDAEPDTPSVPVEAVQQATPSVSVEADQATLSVPVEAVQQATPSVSVDADQSTPSVPVGVAEEKAQQQQIQRATEKPVTGYASEEDYKAALAEKRRQAREAKEREIELERQRQLEEEERERREEEEYLKLLEFQKNAEEERLRKAIEEAERQREEDAIKKEEEERQRIEMEKIEQQKKLEAEEKMKKEEEERQMRKSRVAAIMSRTRGKGPAASTPNKNEAKTPSDDSKNLNDALMSSSMTENLLNTISSSMSDSMIVQAIETQAQKILPPSGQSSEELVSSSSQPPSDISSQPLSDLSSQPLSDVSNQADSPTSGDSSSQLMIESQTEKVATAPIVTESRVVVEENIVRGANNHEQLMSSDPAPVNLLEAQVNGSTLVPMDTTPTTHSVDLLGSFSGVNGINHNGVASVTFQSTETPDNQFGSFDPFSTPSTTLITAETKTECTFDQIIDLNQTKLTNEDAVNSNNPLPPPIIAFEDNLNKKSQQTQDTSSNVPDLLL